MKSLIRCEPNQDGSVGTQSNSITEMKVLKAEGLVNQLETLVQAPHVPQGTYVCNSIHIQCRKNKFSVLEVEGEVKFSPKMS